MWTHETIFSVGDISNRDTYEDFISQNFNGDYVMRYTHVCSMLSRLEFERNFLMSDILKNGRPIADRGDRS